MRRPIQPFKRPAPLPGSRAITGPDNVPAPETRAERVRNLARNVGAQIEVIDARTLDVVCEDVDIARIMQHRIHHACALVGVPEYTWIPREDAPLTFRVDL